MPDSFTATVPVAPPPAPVPHVIDLAVGTDWSEDLAGRVHRLAVAVSRRGASALDPFEEIVGHSLHPALTDLPIGFWTSSWLLDLVGGRASRGASRRLIAAGVVSTLPTAFTGLCDAGRAGSIDRRVVGMHAGCNAAATVAYAGSWWVRRRPEHHGRGVALGMVGAVLATAGGVLGGELVFRDTTEG